MHRMVSGLLMLALAAPALRADDKKPADKPAKSEGFEALKKEFEEAQKEFRKAVNDAKTDEDRQKVIKEKNPGPRFGDKFLSFAEKNPKDPAAYDALVQALHLSARKPGKGSPWAKALAALERDHVKSDKMGPLVGQIAGMPDEETFQFLKAVAEKNPSRKVQGYANKALAANRKGVAELATELKRNDKLRAEIEKHLGKAFVDKLKELDPDKLTKEGEAFAKVVKDKYSDIFPDLSVGKKAPEVVSHDLSGKKVKLSDLRGKVVVLDIWATWCPPCRAMIPHERELVKKLKDKPFVLVSISGDEKKETLTKFIAEEPMPWTHWWNGASGGILADWEVHSFPTIYVLDGKGVIRYKNVRGPAMDKAVETLLGEMEGKKEPAKDKKESSK